MTGARLTLQDRRNDVVLFLGVTDVNGRCQGHIPRRRFGTAQDLRVQFDANLPVHPKKPHPDILPISIAELDFPGVPTPAAPATIDSGCRSDLLTIDGAPFPIEIRGASRDARRGLTIAPTRAAPAYLSGSRA